MKVILVMAPFDLAKSFGLSGKMRRGTQAPLGVGYLAAVLEQHGHAVTFLDAPIMGWSIDETVARIEAEGPDVVGVSCYSLGRFLAFDLVKAVKARLPDIPVVMGGPHVTSYAEKLFEECPDVDAAIIGEAEFSLAEVVDRLRDNAPFDDVPGVIFRNDRGELVMSGPPKPVQDLDALPYPSRHIYTEGVYNPLPIMVSCPQMPSETIIASRGCPWAKCRFCYEGGKYAAPYRRRSPANVIGEIRELVAEKGTRFVIFQDDNFCTEPDWIDAFCDLVDEHCRGLVWAVFGRVDAVTPEMLNRMGASGCYNIFYGFESGNQETLDLVNKGITLDQIRTCVDWTRAAGIEIRGSFMLGFPQETPEMTENSIRFACELNTEYMLFQPYHCLPGTPLEDLAAQEGRFVEHDNVSAQLPSYVPNTYENAEQLAAMVKLAYRRYYLRPGYILHALWRARRPTVFRDYVGKFFMALETMGLR